MSLIWTIAEQALRQTMTGPQPVISAPPRLGLLAAVGFLCLSGTGLMLAAAYLALATITTPALAALNTALIAFSGAAILLGIAGILRNYHRRHRAVREQGSRDAISNAVQMMAEELGEPIKAYPKTAMAVAAIAGLMAGQRIH